MQTQSITQRHTGLPPKGSHSRHHASQLLMVVIENLLDAILFFYVLASNHNCPCNLQGTQCLHAQALVHLLQSKHCRDTVPDKLFQRQHCEDNIADT